MRNHDLLDDKSDDRDNDEPEQYIDDSRKKYKSHRKIKRQIETTPTTDEKKVKQVSIEPVDDSEEEE